MKVTSVKDFYIQLDRGDDNGGLPNALQPTLALLFPFLHDFRSFWREETDSWEPVTLKVNAIHKSETFHVLISIHNEVQKVKIFISKCYENLNSHKHHFNSVLNHLRIRRNVNWYKKYIEASLQSRWYTSTECTVLYCNVLCRILRCMYQLCSSSWCNGHMITITPYGSSTLTTCWNHFHNFHICTATQFDSQQPHRGFSEKEKEIGAFNGAVLFLNSSGIRKVFCALSNLTTLKHLLVCFCHVSFLKTS